MGTTGLKEHLSWVGDPLHVDLTFRKVIKRKKGATGQKNEEGKTPLGHEKPCFIKHIRNLAG